MKTLIASTAALLTLTAGASAQSPTEQAFAQFNQDRSGNEIVEYYGARTDGVAVSTRSGSALGQAYARFNAQVDGENPSALRGRNGASATGFNAVALDVLADIARENRDDDI
jgi:hypothetical protein